jgi:hypothetical protein
MRTGNKRVNWILFVIAFNKFKFDIFLFVIVTNDVFYL